MSSLFQTRTFSHKNIVFGESNWPDKEKSCRPFNTVAEHDAFLLNEINKAVKPTDVLYHLGDFSFAGGAERMKEVRAAIQCETVYLALGNHDKLFSRKSKHRAELLPLFKDVREVYYGKVAGRYMALGHYAMRTWAWQHHLGINLYGHSHGNLPDDPNSLSLDVGVDTCLFGHKRFAPYSADEVFHIMDNHKRFVPVDHHHGER